MKNLSGLFAIVFDDKPPDKATIGILFFIIRVNRGRDIYN